VEEEEEDDDDEEEPEEEDEEDEEEGFSAPADSDESGEDGGETDSGAVDLECGKSQEEKEASASESADSDDDWDIDAEIDACEAEAAARHSTGLSSGGRESRAGRIAAANRRWDSHTGEEFLSYGCSAQTRTLRCPSLSSSALFVAHCPLERLVQVSRTGCFRHARTTRRGTRAGQPSARTRSKSPEELQNDPELPSKRGPPSPPRGTRPRKRRSVNPGLVKET